MRLENALRNFACLSEGDVVAIKYNDKVSLAVTVVVMVVLVAAVVFCDSGGGAAAGVNICDCVGGVVGVVAVAVVGVGCSVSGSGSYVSVNGWGWGGGVEKDGLCVVLFFVGVRRCHD